VNHFPFFYIQQTADSRQQTADRDSRQQTGTADSRQGQQTADSRQHIESTIQAKNRQIFLSTKIVASPLDKFVELDIFVAPYDPPQFFGRLHRDPLHPW